MEEERLDVVLRTGANRALGIGKNANFRKFVIFVLVFATIATLALGMRLPRTSFGLPYLVTVDEYPIIQAARSIVLTGDFNPFTDPETNTITQIRYAHLAVYATVATDIAAFVTAMGRGEVDCVYRSCLDDFFGQSYDFSLFAYSDILLWPRIFTVIVGTLFPMILIWVVARQFRHPMADVAGLAGAFLFAQSFLQYRFSAVLNTDVLSGFWTILVILASIAVIRGKGRWVLVLAGLGAGLAAATKYNAGLVLIVPIIATWLVLPGSGQKFRWYEGLYWAGIPAVGGFLMAQPYALLDLPEFLIRFSREFRLYTFTDTVGPGDPGIRQMLWHVGQYLSWGGVGPISGVLSVIGIGYGLWKYPRVATVAVVFPILVLISLAQQPGAPIKNALHVYPILAVFAGLGFVVAITSGREITAAALHRLGWPHGVVQQWAKSQWLLVGIGVILLAATAPSWLKQQDVLAFETNYLERNDSRTLALNWLSTNVPAGGTVAIAEEIPWDPAVFEQVPFKVVTFPLVTTEPDWFLGRDISAIVTSTDLHEFFFPQGYPSRLFQWEDYLNGPGKLTSFTGLPLGYQRSFGVSLVIARLPSLEEIVRYGGSVTNVEFLTQWGTEGSGEGALDSPNGILVARDGTIWVADGNLDALIHYDAEGNYLGRIGNGKGSGAGQFYSPRDVAQDPQGDIYVVDHANHRVQKFDSNGNYLLEWGEEGLGDGQFQSPIKIFAAPDGVIYVADYANHRIQWFTAEGDFLGKLGEGRGSGPGQFAFPMGMAVDTQGNLYVADSYNNRIQIFDPLKNFIGEFAAGEEGEGDFKRPEDVIISVDGDVYIVNFGNNLIQRYLADGTPILLWGGYGTGSGEFNRPHSLAIGPDGEVYVVDEDGRVQKFAMP